MALVCKIQDPLYTIKSVVLKSKFYISGYYISEGNHSADIGCGRKVRPRQVPHPDHPAAERSGRDGSRIQRGPGWIILNHIYFCA